MSDELQDRDLRARHFVEEIGLVFSEMGSQRMLGRVLGRLLISDPPQQTASELAEYLDASAGSMSTTTRQLVSTGMIERVAVPGERATAFRLRRGMWADLMRRRLTFLTIMRELAQKGLDIEAHESDDARGRIEELRDFYAFMEVAMPDLLARWSPDASPERPGALAPSKDKP